MLWFFFIILSLIIRNMSVQKHAVNQLLYLNTTKILNILQVSVCVKKKFDLPEV